MSECIESKSFEELCDYHGRLDDTAVRRWYIYHDRGIHQELDRSLPWEELVRQAFELRNRYRTQARALMSDTAKRLRLESEHPNPTFEEMVRHKMEDKGLTYEEALEDIYDTVTKTNIRVNGILGLG